MSGPVAKLKEHLRRKEIRDAELMVQRAPSLLTIPDKDGLFPLHIAFVEEAPLLLISLFIHKWPPWQNRTLTVAQLNPLHAACCCGASAEVIYFLLKEFPRMKFFQLRNGNTPLMYYLHSGNRDPEVLQCLSPCSGEFIGDCPPPNFFWSHRKPYDGAFNIQRAVCRLDQHDPTLTEVYLGDMFTEMGNGGLFDVLDAIYRNPHINVLNLIYKNVDSFLWSEGMGCDALAVLLREKTSIRSLTIETNRHDLSSIGDVLQNCRNIKHLFIHSASKLPVENSVGRLAQSVQNLPFLQSVVLDGAIVTYDDARAIAQSLISKRSMIGFRIVRCSINSRAASVIVDALTNDVHCTLQDLSLFIEPHFMNRRYRSWDIEDAIYHNALVQSIEAFVKKVITSYSGTESEKCKFTIASELQFIADIEEANIKDSNNSDPIFPPSHLYSLIRAKPYYIKGGVDHECAYSASNKRRKIN